MRTLKTVIFALIAGVAVNAQATSIECGAHYCHTTLSKAIEVFADEYASNGFKLINRQSNDNSGQLRFLFPVVGSRYENEVREDFTIDSEKCVYVCGSIHVVKEPTNYDPEERNPYVLKLEKAMKKVSDNIGERLPRKR